MICLQIIKYKWENWEPVLTVKDPKDEKISKIRLLDHDVAIKLGKKHCIGFFHEGKHSPCPENRITKTGWYCNECKSRDDFFLCIKCDGTECINPKRRDECKVNNYFIYLAAFDSLLKVGISYEHRLIERLVEQGADFGAKVAFVQDGKNVRKIEQQIKKNINAVDRIRGDEKHDTLFANPNHSAARIYKAILKLRNNGLNCLIDPEIYDMRKYYMLQNVPVSPDKMDIKEDVILKGRIVAAKGNMLVLSNGNGFFSVNSHRLIGHDIDVIS